MLPNKKSLAKKVGVVGSTTRAGPSTVVNKRTNLMPSPVGPNVKKQRVDVTKVSSSAVGSNTSVSLPKLVEQDVSWMESVKDFNLVAKDFSSLMAMAKEKGKNRQVKVICGAIKVLLKGDEPNQTDLALLREVHQCLKQETTLYTNPLIYGAVFTLMNRVETQASVADLSLLPIISNILQAMETWPLSLFNFVLFDSMGLRLWVDRTDATPIVLAAFSLVGKLQLPGDHLFNAISDNQSMFIKDVGNREAKYNYPSDQTTAVLRSTLAHMEKCIDAGASRNLLRTLCLFCAGESFRLLAAKKLDQWLLNLKTQRQAMELLLFVVCNTKDADSDTNLEVLGSLTRVKLQKSKQLHSVFQLAVKEILTNCTGSLKVLTDFVLENEFIHVNKAHSNLGFLQFLYSSNQSEVCKMIAEKLVKRLESADQIKTVRAFVREVFRCIRDLSFAGFAAELFTVCTKYTDAPPLAQASVFRGVFDICVMLPFVGATTVVKEAAQARRSSSQLLNSQADALNRFQVQLQRLQVDGVRFLTWTAANFALDQRQGSAIMSLCGLLYLKGLAFYTTAEAWPNEAEFNHVMRLIGECPVDQNLLQALIDAKPVAGPREIIGLLDNITKRLLTMKGVEPDQEPYIQAEDGKLATMLFDLTAMEQSLSRLAFKDLYWQSWELLAIWCTVNQKLLTNIFYRYPNLRLVLSMLITKDFHFPPPALDEKMKAELSAADAEEFEAELVASQELDSNDDISPQPEDAHTSPSPENIIYTFLRPEGPCRSPPSGFLKNLARLSKEYELGTTLCQSRHPDLVHKFAGEQGPLRLMPAITNYLVHKPDALDQMPLQCLAQLYMIMVCEEKTGKSPEDLCPTLATIRNVGQEIRSKISSTISKLVTDIKSEVEDSKTVIMYMTSKLATSFSFERDVASIALNTILKPETQATDFDAYLLTGLPNFQALKEPLCLTLASACSLEKRTERVVSYMHFIVEHIGDASLHRAAPSLSSLVEKSNTASTEHQNIRRSLMGFFADYIRKLIKTGPKQVTEDTSTLDRTNMLSVRLSTGEEIKIDAEIVTAIMELLCESSDDSGESTGENSPRRYLMNVWFPSSSAPPTPLQVSSLSNPAEKIALLPPALRMKMLSANDQRIVQAALDGITATDALQYIQSFALTPYSCSQLLARLDLPGMVRSKEARLAIPFVRAYKIRGANGADAFLDALAQADAQVKMEVDQSASLVINPPNIDPPPNQFRCTTQPVSSSKPSLKTTANSLPNCFDRLIKDNAAKQKTFTSSPTWSEFASHLKKPQSFGVLVTIIRSRFDALKTSFKHILAALIYMSCQETVKNPSLRPKMAELAAFIQQNVPVAHPFEIIVKPFLLHDRQQTDRSKGPAPVDITRMSADDVLAMLLQKSASTPEDFTTNTNLMKQYLLMRPEVFDHVNPTALEGQIKVLFASTCQAAKHLIAQITTCRTPILVIRVLSRVLGQYEPSLEPVNVVEFTQAALESTGCVTLDDEKVNVLSRYVLNAIETDTQVEHVGQQLLKILESMQDSVEIEHMSTDPGKNVLKRISKLVEEIPLASSTAQKRKRLNRLHDIIQQRFPVPCTPSTKPVQKTRRALLTTPAARTLSASVDCLDEQMHWALNDFFELSAVPRDKDAQLAAQAARADLIRLAERHPDVLARQIPLLVNRVHAILGLTVRQLRDVDHLPVLFMVIQLVQRAVPYSFDRKQAMETFVGAFLSEFEKQHFHSRTWLGIIEAVFRLVMNFMASHPMDATDLVRHHKSRCTLICESFPDNQTVQDFVQSFPLVFSA